MKKTISILLLLLLLIPSFGVFVFAEKAHTMKPLYRKAWNVHIDLSDKAAIDEALADYDIMNMPAIECYDGFSFVPLEFEKWESLMWNVKTDSLGETRNYLLFCEKTGDVLRIRHNISEEKEEVKLLCIYKYHEYPTWLVAALGLGRNIYLDDSQRVSKITQIIVSEPSFGPYHLRTESVVCFETDGGQFITVIDDSEIAFIDEPYTYVKNELVVSLKYENYLVVLEEYHEYFREWYKHREVLLGSPAYPSFFAAFVCGNPPEINKDTNPALYIGIAVAVVAVIAIAVAIIIVIKKRRKGNTN